jgi:DNA-binding transcriptional LysR family regulator
VTKMIGEGDMIGLLAGDVGRYYAQHGIVALLPIELPCRMDAFGLITRTDRPLSPAAKVMLAALKRAAGEVYGVALEV